MLFQGEIITKKRKIHCQIVKNHLLQNHWANFNKTWHNASLDEGPGIQDFSNEGLRPFPRGDNNEIAKNTSCRRRIWKIFYSRTTVPISTKQLKDLFKGEIWLRNSEIWKIFFSRITSIISTKLGTMHPWVNGIQFCSKEGPLLFPRGDNYEIAKIHWRIWNIF